jgi:hypothetical protein
MGEILLRNARFAYFGFTRLGIGSRGHLPGVRIHSVRKIAPACSGQYHILPVNHPKRRNDRIRAAT